MGQRMTSELLLRPRNLSLARQTGVDFGGSKRAMAALM
jgi:hypothetical protein